MSPRTVRTIHTVIQLVIGLATAVPDLVAGLPLGAVGAQAIAVAAIVTHEFHLIEQIPGFPESLKID